MRDSAANILNHPTAEDRITELVTRVQALVLEKAKLALTAEEIVKIHLLSMEPEYLAKTIVFSVTGNVFDLSEDADDGEPPVVLPTPPKP